MIQAHACFAKETRDASIRQHGLPEIERLHSIGALGSNLLLVHCGWLSPKEPELLREFDVKVVACASSSMHNAYGNILMGSIPELLEMGVAVSVGSDHACSGIVDLPTEMFMLSSAYKEVRLDPKVLPPERLLEMATLNGAACALWQNEIGSLEAGKKADISMFRTDSSDWLPLYIPGVTTHMGPGKPGFFPDVMDEQDPGLHIVLKVLAVDLHLDPMLIPP